MSNPSLLILPGDGIGPEVMAEVRKIIDWFGAKRGVTFDVCPLSNVGLRVVPALRDHPIRRLMAAGVRCTVSTDDPLCFANSVNDEYAALVEELGFSRAELASVAKAGWEVADVPSAAREAMVASINRIAVAT